MAEPVQYKYILSVDAGRGGGACTLFEIRRQARWGFVLRYYASWEGAQGYDRRVITLIVDAVRDIVGDGSDCLVVVEPAIIGRGGLRAVWSIGLSAGPFTLLGHYAEAPNGTWQADMGVVGSTEERKRGSIRMAKSMLRAGDADLSEFPEGLLYDIEEGNHHLADAVLIAFWAVKRLKLNLPITATPIKGCGRKATRGGYTGGQQRPTYGRCVP